jgi:DNA-3-methyladenine glycosylase II
MTADAVATLRDDPDLRPLIERHGTLTVDPADDFFARFVVSIVRQQISMASAEATRERLFDAVEITPRGVLAADEAVLSDAGLSRQKVRYVRNVAEVFLDRGYTRETFVGVPDDAVIDELTDITGVGTWTAKMQLLFSLGRPDVFPVEDLGIREGMRTLYGDVDRGTMVETATRWRPYRSYASLYLWQVGEDVTTSVEEVRRE